MSKLKFATGLSVFLSLAWFISDRPDEPVTVTEDTAVVQEFAALASKPVVVKIPPATTTTSTSTTTPPTTAPPTTTPTVPPEPEPEPVVEAASVPEDVWYQLAMCETNMTNDTGDPYWGYFQFSLQTWHGIGESGYPSDYDYEYQRAAAQRLQERSGWGQWPACSRELGLR